MGLGEVKRFPDSWLLVREVGFEPTNPCGTGASGLRFQGPVVGLFDLAWQLGTLLVVLGRSPAFFPGPPARLWLGWEGPNLVFP